MSVNGCIRVRGAAGSGCTPRAADERARRPQSKQRTRALDIAAPSRACRVDSASTARHAPQARPVKISSGKQRGGNARQALGLHSDSHLEPDDYS